MLRQLIAVLRSSPGKIRRPAHHRASLQFELLERRELLAAGIVATHPKRLITSEDGGSNIIGFALTQAPAADVIISLTSSKPNEGLPDVDSVIFTPANWNLAHNVRIVGQADGVRDGKQEYHIITGNAVSLDAAYDGLEVPDFTLTNKDSKKLLAGITVSKTRLSTTEDGGTASFTVKLNFRPKADVTIAIASSNPQEGIPNVSELVFTPDNFAQPQTVTITGQPDGIKDGNKKYQIVTGSAVSADPVYNGMQVADVQVTNKNSKSLVAGVTVTPTKGLFTDELGGIAPFTIVLTYQPTANVTIPLSSSNSAEGNPHVGSVTFTPGDWNVPKQVLIVGRDDGVYDRDVKYTIITGPAISADPLYANMNAADVAVTNRARVDVRRFDGTYQGSYTGKVNGVTLPPGIVRATVSNGVITVILPAAGQGTINATGTLGFGLSAGSVAGAVFKGTFIQDLGQPITRAKGTWQLKMPGVTASGFWDVVKI